MGGVESHRGLERTASATAHPQGYSAALGPAMRLWTLHPRYLDPQGLVALWREALLAQRVLAGSTRGYRNHPQLVRFRQAAEPFGAIASYLRSAILGLFLSSPRTTWSRILSSASSPVRSNLGKGLPAVHGAEREPTTSYGAAHELGPYKGLQVRRVACVIILLAVGCASAGPRLSPSLTGHERRVLEAVLEYERTNFQSPREVFVLDVTDPWLPTEESVAKKHRRPEGVSPEIWAQVQLPKFPEGLRRVNTKPYRVEGIGLPPGFRLFDSTRFERAWAPSTTVQEIEASLAKPAPLVLSFSRPYVAQDGGEAFVVEHVLSTWSGCGGINLLRVTQSEGEWSADFYDGWVTW